MGVNSKSPTPIKSNQLPKNNLVKNMDKLPNSNLFEKATSDLAIFCSFTLESGSRMTL